MKSKVVKVIIGFILFLLLLAATAASLQPVYRRVNSEFLKVEQKYLAVLTEKTDLRISYKSLSPSILAGIRIKGIEVCDAESSEVLFTAKKAVLSYSLKKLLAGDMEHAFSKLTVNSASFTFDFEENWNVFQRIWIETLGHEEKNISPEEMTAEDLILFNRDTQKTLTKLLHAFPFDVVLKNINIHLIHPQADVTTFVKNLRAKKQDGTNYLSVSGKGEAIASFPVLDGDTVGFNYTVSGTFIPELTDSTLMFSVSQTSKASYTLYRGDFLARYADQHLSVLSTQRLLPYFMALDLNLDTSDVFVEASFEDFNPFTLVKAPSLSGAAASLVGSTLSGGMDVLYSIKKHTLEWNADASVSLSKKLAPKGERLALKAKGNNTDIEIDSLIASGSLASGSLTGTFNIPMLQPSGQAKLDYYTLPNGNRISAELFVDPVGDGFSCYIPSLRLGNEQVFNSVQLNIDPRDESWDFEFSLSDYTHLDSDEPGELSVEGTFSLGSYPWIQASVSIASFYLDSVARSLAFVLDGDMQETVQNLIPSLEHFIMINELYLSSDFKSVTFNSPYMFIVSTDFDSMPLAALASFDGNDESVSVSSLQVSYGKNLLKASADVDLSLEEKSALFIADLNFNDIPYSLSGSLLDGKWLSVTGDYGLAVSTSLSSPLSGTATIQSFPFSINDYLLSLSLDSTFAYSKNFGFSVDIEAFEAEELSGKLPFMPRIALTGRLYDQSFVISSLSYADSASALSGDGFLVWSRNDDVFEAFSLQLGLDSDVSKENVFLSASLTNPLMAPLNGEALQKDWFFDAQLDIGSLLMSRFLSFQNADDTLSATVLASGTAENPFISAEVKGVSVEFNGNPAVASGTFVLEDGTVGISRLNASWNGIRLLNLEAGIDVSSFNGLAQSTLDVDFMGKTLNAPLTITIENAGEPYPEGTPILEMLSIPNNFTLSIDSNRLSGNLTKKDVPLHLELNRYSDEEFDMWEFRTDDYFGASGYLFDNGQLTVAIEDSKPLHFMLDGSINTNQIDFNLSNFYLDMSQFAFLVNSDIFSVYNGVLSGDLSVSGIATDPAMEGSFVLEGFEFNVPSYIEDHFTSRTIQLSLHENTLNIPSTEFKVKDTSVLARATLELDRWSLSGMRAYIVSDSERGVPLNIRTDLAHVKGRATVDVNLDYADGTLDVSGDLGLNNTTISLMDSSDEDDDDDDFYSNPLKKKAQKEAKKSSSEESGLPVVIAADIHFVVGEKVRLELNPLLRSLVSQGNSIDIMLDTSNSTWSVKGDVSLRGGEVSYLNRNFYLKEGSVSLNETQAKMDPLITVRAETRERDSSGNSVTISLEASRQYLSQFSPHLYATPAKSEKELYELLGQVALADASNVSSLLISTVDYGVQVAVVRKIEDALRDLLNFDIFSIRTSLLQNAVRTGLDSSTTSSGKRASIGNYFDNSTVYIGKYFGTSLYADAMLHWTYDENKDLSDSGSGGIVFQPEIGLEMEAPFANIRWNFAPDLENFSDSVVSSASVTLSWRFTF